jgi:hypothetical protein
LLRAVDQSQAAAVFLGALVCSDQHAEPGRIHELEAAQVNYDELCVRLRHTLELLLECGAGREIELAADADDGGGIGVAHLYPEMTLHGGARVLI